jgi:protein-S-isoprenylcysteine O-methyltransferase Ste14
LEQNYGEKQIVRKARLLVAAQFSLLGLLFLKPKAAVLLAPSWAPGLAFVIDVCATVILFFAWYALRASLQVSPIPKEGAALVTSGIYRYVRHPMYIGVLLFGLGFVLTNINWISILIWMALLATLIYKARFEDALLLIKHSHASTYQSKTIGLMGKKVEE